MGNLLKIYGTFLLILCSFFSLATHIRGGVITVRKLDNLKFKFTFIGYRDRGSTIPLGGGYFDFGDGNHLENIGAQSQIFAVPINDDVDSVAFEVVYQYEDAGNYIVSYSEEYRNADIINMSNSVVTAFYVETMFNTEVDNSSPLPPSRLLAPFHVGQIGTRSFQFSDNEGDILKYSLTVPGQSRSQYVNSYRYPDNGQFYSDYENGNFLGDGTPVFALDRMTGTLVWDVPGDGIQNANRQYTVAIQVDEYRVVSGAQKRISSTVADILLNVEESSGPSLNVIRQEDKFCTENAMEFEVNSSGAYNINIRPLSLISSINGITVSEISDSTFSTGSEFTVAFTDFEEGQFVTFDINAVDGEKKSSFTYLLSTDCEQYILDTPKPVTAEVVLYPNPAYDKVWIKNGTQNMKYAILSIDGRRVTGGNVDAGSISLPRMIISGVYLLRLYSKDQMLISTHKLIIRD